MMKNIQSTPKKDDNDIITTSPSIIKSEISHKRNEKFISALRSSKWQEINFKTRKNDKNLRKGCYNTG